MKKKLKMKKKKNKSKGFTLIELLAVIVILSIVMVVTIPSVIIAMEGARKSQFENAIQGVADWLTKQAELSALDLETSSEYDAFVSAYADNNGEFKNSYVAVSGINHNLDTCHDESVAMLEAAGIASPNDVIDLEKTYVWIADNKVGIASMPKEGGMFYISGDSSVTIANAGANDQDYLSTGNLFDMSLFSNGGFDYRIYNFNNCGFMASDPANTSSCTGTFSGQLFNFDPNKKYKVTFTGHASVDSQMKVVYTTGTTGTLGNIPASTDNTFEETKSNVSYLYFKPTSGGSSTIYVTSLKVEEVND